MQKKLSSQNILIKNFLFAGCIADICVTLLKSVIVTGVLCGFMRVLFIGACFFLVIAPALKCAGCMEYAEEKDDPLLPAYSFAFEWEEGYLPELTLPGDNAVLMEDDHAEEMGSTVDLSNVLFDGIFSPHLLGPMDETEGPIDSPEEDVDTPHVLKKQHENPVSDHNDQGKSEQQLTVMTAACIQVYQKALANFSQKKIPQHAFWHLVGARKEKLARFLSQRRGQQVTISEILKGAQLNYYHATRFQDCLKDVLGLVLTGVPIEYDKERGTVIFLQSTKKLQRLPETENAFTMTYDIARRYVKFTIEELVYYAHERGLWDDGFAWHKGVQRSFYDYFANIRIVLGVLKFVDVECFGPALKKSMRIWVSLWRIIKYERELHDLDYYKRKFDADLTQRDLDVMRDLKHFTQGSQHAVLVNYVGEKDDHEEDVLSDYAREIKAIVIDKVRCLRTALLSVCRARGLSPLEETWSAISDLMCLNGPGRLAYDVKEQVFFWDKEGRRAFPKRKDYVVDFFCLTTDYPSLSQRMALCILRQNGYAVSNLTELNITLQSLGVLGLVAPKTGQDDLARERQVTDFLLSGAMGRARRDATQTVQPWMKRICSRVANWTTNTVMLDLWKSYLKRRDTAEVFKAPKRTTVGAHGTKRRCKRAQVMSTPEDIIFREMPFLYAFLHERGVWNGAVKPSVTSDKN